MQILIAIVGIVAAGAFWWYRIRYMGKAAYEGADALGHALGHASRKKVALGPLTAIDDPFVAATTVMLAIASEDVPISDPLESRLRQKIAPVAASEQKADEAVLYAKWATTQVADVQIVIDKTTLLLNDKLSKHQKEKLVSMVRDVTPPDERHMMFERRVELLRQKLGLMVRD